MRNSVKRFFVDSVAPQSRTCRLTGAKTSATSAVDSGAFAVPWPFLRAGDSVQIISGPLSGVECFLVKAPDKTRLVVCIDMLQRSARALADTPTQFHVTVIPSAPFLAVPENSSENREYLPIGWLEPPIIPSNKLRFIKDGDLWHFGVLTSRIHMVWLRYVGGRIKSDFQYSIGILYNTFPWPEATPAQREKICGLARAVLDARKQNSGSTLADLYDSDVMPVQLRRAHRALVEAVDKLYRSAPFTSDRERAEHLFGLYEKMVPPLMAAASGSVRRSRNNRSHTDVQ
jgi:hypothetical protein